MPAADSENKSELSARDKFDLTRTCQEAAMLIASSEGEQAYHFSRALEATTPNADSILPSWLLRSLVIGRHVRYASGEIVAQLNADFAQFDEKYFTSNPSDWNLGFSFLTLAAVLRPALLAPMTGAGNVLFKLRSHLGGAGNLFEFSGIVMEFSDRNQPLDLSALKKVSDVKTWKAELGALQIEIKIWREQARASNVQYWRANKVWRKWQDPDGLITKLLQPLERRDLKQSEINALPPKLRGEVERLSQRAEVEREISYTHRKVLGMRDDDIIGRPLEQIYARVQGALELVQKWIELQETSPHREKTYSQEQAEILERKLDDKKLAVEAELENFGKEHSSPFAQIGQAVLRHALEDLWHLFDKGTTVSFSEPPLKYLLNAELLKFNLPLDENWEAEASAPDVQAAMLQILSENSDNWTAAFNRHLARRDHEATGRIIEFLGAFQSDAAGIDLSGLVSARNENIVLCLDALRRDIEQTKKDVEEIGDLGLLKEKEQEELKTQIKNTEARFPKDASAARQTNFAEVDGLLLRFGERHDELQKLREKVRANLEAERERVQQRLDERDLPHEGEEWKRINSLLEQGDVWTAKECLEMLERGESLPENSTAENVFTRFFPETLGEIIAARLDEQKIIRDLRHFNSGQYQLGALDWSKVVGKEAKQAADWLEAWFALKENGRIDEKNLRAVLSGLGFKPREIQIPPGRGRFHTANVTCEPIADRNRCPVPFYGSDAKGRYRILCVWERPTPEDLLNGSSR